MFPPLKNETEKSSSFCAKMDAFPLQIDIAHLFQTPHVWRKAIGRRKVIKQNGVGLANDAFYGESQI